MRILITGGSGFLGSHLTDCLLAEGHSVRVIDNLMTGREKNLSSAVKQGGFLGLVKKDIVTMTDVFSEQIYDPYDVVFNFACPASPPAYQKSPIHTMMTCVVGTRNILDLATRDRALFIQASTSEIYGDPEVHPQVETYKGCVNSIGPRACYDNGKRAAETLCFDYMRTGTYAKLGRIFNTFGPRMDPNDGRVVSNFIVQALQGNDITIYGDGTQTRSFCYVSDLIAGFMKLMYSQADFTGPVNLGNPNEFTMNELAETVIRLVDSKSKVTYMPLPKDDPRQRRPDILLAQSKLNWEPKIQLEEGLRRTIEYFKKEI